MQIDIPLAGWLLSLVAFILGTVTPYLYRRFFYEGISVQQAHDIRAITQNDQEKSRSHVVFSTTVKFANSGGRTVLVDAIETSTVKTSDSVFEPFQVELKSYSPKEDIHLPPSSDPAGVDYLPVLIKTDEERIFAIGFRFHYTPKDAADTLTKLSDYIEADGLKVSFRINGKYRSYILRIRRPED